MAEEQSEGKLFVGNVTFQTRERDLEEIFAAYGTVKEARLAVDSHTGRSKGFAFVTMSTREEAEEAVRKAVGLQIDGRDLRVELSSNKPRRDREGGGGRRDGEGRFGREDGRRDFRRDDRRDGGRDDRRRDGGRDGGRDREGGHGRRDDHRREDRHDDRDRFRHHDRDGDRDRERAKRDRS